MAEIDYDVKKARDLLISGEIVAIPTETVYGLAANVFDEMAVAKIFEAKDRPFFDPLIVHIAETDDPGKYVSDIPDIARILIANFWPGSLTLILPKKDIIPDLVTSGQNTVGLRMPNHPLTQQLLALLPFPLAAPSANPFGYISPTTAQHVFDQLGDKIPYILDGGPCEVGLESTIIGFEGDIPVLYRLGGIPMEEIEAITGPLRTNIHQSSNPAAPGQLLSHYAPKKPLYIGDIHALLLDYSHKRVGVISFQKHYAGSNIIQNWVLSQNGSLQEAAAHLFTAMREADQSTSEILLAEVFPDKGLGRAINDRLSRARKGFD